MYKRQDHHDARHSTLSFVRRGRDAHRSLVLVVCNFTPTVHRGWRVGVPQPGTYVERLNTDSQHYGGSNVGTPLGRAASMALSAHGRPQSIVIDLPPLATVMFEWTPP